MALEKLIDSGKSDIDDILDKFSIYNSFHLKIAALIFLGFATNTAYSSNFIFIAEEVNYTCVKYSPHNSTEGCIEWVYDDPSSFVAEFQLAGQEWKRTLVGTIHSLVYMIGLLIVGPLSDRFGRKNAFIITGVFGGIFGLARSFSHSYWSYIALEFLEAFIGDTCSPAYVLMMEIVSTKQRLKFILMCTIGYTFGGFALAIAAGSIPYWRTLLQAIYTPALLFYFYKYFLDESPRWLLIQGRKEDAVKILERAAKENRVKLDKNINEKLSCDTEESGDFLKIIKITFKSKTLCVRFFVCLIWWTASTFVHYGLTINSVSLQGNKYVNFALISVFDLPGLFVITLILIYCKRKVPLIFCFFAAATLCFTQPFLPKGLPWLSITVFMAGKLMSSFYFNITYLYTSELFPTYTRNSIQALCSSLGRIGSIVSPQTPLLIQYWSGLPSLVFGLVSLIGGIVTFLVPDISSDSLPDTASEAEQIGKSKNNCKLYC
ncbi:solute carrier family 22 member 1-like [Battus philenor]|uniref:solute carrier family 22 member 1-like n=1 Tax=Battus philenor TaxID=42288 RepID=UPI0035CF7E28